MSSPKAYDEYKNVNHELFDQIPAQWELFKAAHLFNNIGSGTTPKSDNHEFYEDGEVFWLTTGDLNDKNLTSCDGKITRKALEEHSALKEYPEGSVAIAMYGATIGKTAMLQFRTTTNQACCVFPASTKIHNKYFHYQLLSLKPYILSLAVGGGQPNINQEILKSLKITVPKFKEQLFIARFLDIETAKIDALIVEQERLIKLLQEKRQAVISHAVTKGLNPDAPMKESGVQWVGEVPEHWDAKPLKYFCKITTGFAFKSEDFVDTGIPLLRISNITREGSVNLEEAKFLNPSKLEENPDKAILQGDLVMAMTGATIGKVGIYEAQEIALLNQRVCIFRALENSNRQYLFLLLQSRAYQEHIFLTAFGGAQPNISDKELLQKSLPLPPLHEQQEISQEVESKTGKIQNTIKESNKLIRILNERRSALISAAVTGQIDVRGFATAEEVAA